MNTSEQSIGMVRRRRRRHSEAFKAEAVAACLRPGVSIAAVALSRGLNANLLRRWLVRPDQGCGILELDLTLAHPVFRVGSKRKRSGLVGGNLIIVWFRRFERRGFVRPYSSGEIVSPK